MKLANREPHREIGKQADDAGAPSSRRAHSGTRVIAVVMGEDEVVDVHAGVPGYSGHRLDALEHMPRARPETRRQLRTLGGFSEVD
jgi:hypothetical protein